jgi:hypothetical protein
MKSHRLLVALAASNAILGVALLAREGGVSAAATPDVVRARALEIVDDAGRVRAQIDVEEGGSVVFRLRDASGELRVKLGADRDGSGLLLANGATEPGVHALAKNEGSMLTLRNKDGRQQVVRP